MPGSSGSRIHIFLVTPHTSTKVQKILFSDGKNRVPHHSLLLSHSKIKKWVCFFFYWILYIFLSTWVWSIMDFDYSLSIEFISNDFEVQMMK